MIYHDLAKKIQSLAKVLPEQSVEQLAIRLSEITDITDASNYQDIVSTVINPKAHYELVQLLQYWRNYYSQLSGDAIALGLMSVTTDTIPQTSAIELVWTGPNIHEVNLRQTEQILLDLINTAQQSLHIMSFAVYRIGSILRAIDRALERGVSVAIYLETPFDGQNTVRYDPRMMLSNHIREKASLYVWPLSQRDFDSENRYGALHAKVAVSDQEQVFITSANLTDYAMQRNIELGTIIHDATLARRMVEQFNRMINKGILVKS